MILIFAMLMRYSHSTYHQEAEQKVYADVARRFAVLAGWSVDGWRDPDAAAAAFSSVVEVNPHFNVFILDREGRISAHYPQSARLATSRVSLQPIRQMLRPDPPFPLLGDDPFNSGERGIFSVVELKGGNRPEQYLYVTLHSEERHASSEALRWSYLTREGAWLIGASLALALAGGLLSLHFIVRPIRRLAWAMDRFREHPHIEVMPLSQEVAASGDEIDLLTHTFYRMAVQIQEQMQVIERNDATRREFIASVSHDLRTPLASIQGYLDTLLLKNATLRPEERSQYLQTAIRQSQSLNKLIETLFYLAKLDSGQIALEPEAFKVEELVQDVLQKFTLHAEAQDIRLQVQAHGNLPFVCADLALMERVLSNLIDNALQHTPGGGIITLRLEYLAKKVWVSITDTGTGVPAADLPHIFERFYRGPDFRSDASGNAGLGLSIVHRILAMHGAAITVQNAPDSGAVFRFGLNALESPDARCNVNSFSASR